MVYKDYPVPVDCLQDNVFTKEKKIAFENFAKHIWEKFQMKIGFLREQVWAIFDPDTLQPEPAMVIRVTIMNPQLVLQPGVKEEFNKLRIEDFFNEPAKK